MGGRMATPAYQFKYKQAGRTLRANSIHYNTIQYNTILYNTLNYAIVSRHQINTCTVLYSSVLYCIKIRKFAQTRQRTFQKLKSTLGGSWPIRKFAHTQRIWNTERPFQ